MATHTKPSRIFSIFDQYWIRMTALVYLVLPKRLSFIFLLVVLLAIFLGRTVNKCPDKSGNDSNCQASTGFRMSQICKVP